MRADAVSRGVFNMHIARTSGLAAAAAAAGLSLLAAGGAGASQTGPQSYAPNYTFPNGFMGFALESHGGPINPGVIVGFNPQPDPPGFGGDDGALIALLNPADPQLFNPSTGGAFSFELALDLGDGSVIPLPDAPGDGQHTSYRGVIDGHNVDIALTFGPGDVNPGTWASFNPQPDPPGDVLAGQFQFFGREDPIMSFTVSIDGDPLSFTLAPGVPEPQTWALMLLGFGGAGGALRARATAATVGALGPVDRKCAVG
jgi:hypothetical protein